MKKSEGDVISLACSVLTNPITKRMLMNHDRTEAEEQMLRLIIQILQETGYSGEIHCRCFFGDSEGKGRRPDLFLPRYLLPIEIDGKTRDTMQARLSDLEVRDSVFEDLGTRPILIIPANWVNNQFKMDRFKHEFTNFIYTEHLTPTVRKKVNTRISRGRAKLEKKHPQIFGSHGSKAPQFDEIIKNEFGLEDIRHFGGTKYILRGEYEKATHEDKERRAQLRKIRNVDLNLPDFSTPEGHGHYVAGVQSRR